MKEEGRHSDKKGFEEFPAEAAHHWRCGSSGNREPVSYGLPGQFTKKDKTMECVSTLSPRGRGLSAVHRIFPSFTEGTPGGKTTKKVTEKAAASPASRGTTFFSASFQASFCLRILTESAWAWRPSAEARFSTMPPSHSTPSLLIIWTEEVLQKWWMSRPE